MTAIPNFAVNNNYTAKYSITKSLYTCNFICSQLQFFVMMLLNMSRNIKNQWNVKLTIFDPFVTFIFMSSCKNGTLCSDLRVSCFSGHVRLGKCSSIKVGHQCDAHECLLFILDQLQERYNIILYYVCIRYQLQRNNEVMITTQLRT